MSAKMEFPDHAFMYLFGHKTPPPEIQMFARRVRRDKTARVEREGKIQVTDTILLQETPHDRDVNRHDFP